MQDEDQAENTTGFFNSKLLSDRINFPMHKAFPRLGDFNHQRMFHQSLSSPQHLPITTYGHLLIPKEPHSAKAEYHSNTHPCSGNDYQNLYPGEHQH